MLGKPTRITNLHVVRNVWPFAVACQGRDEIVDVDMQSLVDVQERQDMVRDVRGKWEAQNKIFHSSLFCLHKNKFFEIKIFFV
jgi:hypothetical protein